MSAEQPPLTADADVMRAWLTHLYAGLPGYISVCSDADGWVGRRFTTDGAGIEAAVQYALELDRKRPKGIYTQVTTLREAPATGRGGEDLAHCLPYLWADGDFGTIGHKPGLDDLPTPPDADSVAKVVAESGLPAPTGWSYSGGGYNPGWVLTEARIIGDEEDRARIKQLTTSLQTILGAAAYRNGWSWDVEVGNLDRLMKLPGSINRKEGLERPTSIGPSTGVVYTLDELYEVTERLAPQARKLMEQADREKRDRKIKRLGVSIPPPRPDKPRGNHTPGTGPFDALQDAASWEDILKPAGFTYEGTHSDGREKWLRPPDANGRASSAYSLLCNDHVAINWSERADLPVGALAHGHKLTKGTVFAHLYYAGDRDAAGRDLLLAANGRDAIGHARNLPAPVLAEIQRRSGTPAHQPPNPFVQPGPLQQAADAAAGEDEFVPDWPEAEDEPPAEEEPIEAPEEKRSRFTLGGSFVLDVPDTPPAIWGEGGDVLWAEGEALMLCAPQGVGKTTIAHQVIRARLGLQDSVLGFPVTPGERVLLLSMDRPAQARRAANRIFGKDDRKFLDEHLVVWEGPPPYDVAKHTDILAAMCEAAEADTVVVDSLKDAAIGLSEDEVGAGYNRARQKALAAGVQVLELHHLTKRGPNGAAPNDLAGVYGSVWLTSGAGSVILLWGEAGDPVVNFRHLKQPMNELGPFNIVHDHASGISSVQHTADLLELARFGGPEGLSATRAAEAIFDTKNPTPAQREKARRRLDKLVNSGHLVRHEGPTKTSPATYYLGLASAS